MSNVHGMIRSAYKFNPDVVSNETALDTGEDAVTQQCFKDECDINILLAKFAVTGHLPENVRVPQYVDFEEAFDFHSSMNVIRAAEEAFNAMPAHIVIASRMILVGSWNSRMTPQLRGSVEDGSSYQAPRKSCCRAGKRPS